MAKSVNSRSSAALRKIAVIISLVLLNLGATQAQAKAAQKPKYGKSYSSKSISEKMIGIWVMTTDPSRVLTIKKNLQFTDSKITYGTLQSNGQPGLYTFLYQGQPKCRVYFVPIGKNKLLLNDDHVRNPACILGLLNRVS